jgi:hypothetical protein
MAFIAGMLTAGIMAHLLPAAPVSIAARPDIHQVKGLINVFPENKILPG